MGIGVILIIVCLVIGAVWTLSRAATDRRTTMY
jgi:hypothetical protein